MPWAFVGGIGANSLPALPQTPPGPFPASSSSCPPSSNKTVGFTSDIKAFLSGYIFRAGIGETCPNHKLDLFTSCMLKLELQREPPPAARLKTMQQQSNMLIWAYYCFEMRRLNIEAGQMIVHECGVWAGESEKLQLLGLVYPRLGRIHPRHDYFLGAKR